MRRRYFSQGDKEALLDAIKECRSACIVAERSLDPASDTYKATLRVAYAIDELSSDLTGDSDYFHIKTAPSKR